MPAHSRTNPLLMLIVAAALACRFVVAFCPTFFAHEVAPVARAVLPLGQIATLYREEVASPLFVLLVKICMNASVALGPPFMEIQWLRLLPFCAGAAALALAIVAAERWWGGRAAIFAALLVGFFPTQVLASTLLSPHALVQVPVLASTAVLIRFGRMNPKGVVLYALCAIAACLVAFGAWRVIVLQMIVFLIVRRFVRSSADRPLYFLLVLSFGTFFFFNAGDFHPVTSLRPIAGAMTPIHLLALSRIMSWTTPRLLRAISWTIWLTPVAGMTLALHWTSTRDASTIFNSIKPIDMPLTTDSIVWTNERIAPWLARAGDFTLASSAPTSRLGNDFNISQRTRPVWFVAHRDADSPALLTPEDARLIETLETTQGAIKVVIPARRREWSRIWLVPAIVLPDVATTRSLQSSATGSPQSSAPSR